MMLQALFILLSISSLYGFIQTENNLPRNGPRLCAKHKDASENGLNVSLEQTIEACETDNCFTFWLEDPNNGSIVILKQGCWVSSGNSDACGKSQCINLREPSKVMNNTKYCCCTGDLCNSNFTDAYVPIDDIPPPVLQNLPKSSINIITIICTLVAITGLIVLILIYIYWQSSPKKEDIEIGGNSNPPSADLLLNKLKVLSVIGQGRYGSVCKGMIDDQEVAVKIFPAHHRNYFLNECDLYKEACEHSSLLKCFGGGERCSLIGGPTEYLLILSLEQECLQEYLKMHMIDLATLSRMSLCIASGLAHLHSDLGKPCIAHRDLNSRNILVRPNLNCCICDLGLAVVPKRTENRALSEAGTLRYMAPEVLEGAVNLRDCESALKQIDVYSLGLVLWELGSRCIDMQVIEPQLYASPYYKEVGDHPTLEQMQCLVSRHKARPLWPLTWKDTAAARLLRETAEDCWDQDAEARLTSLCVEERLLELPTLRGRILHPLHQPVSPTPLINNNHLHDHNIDSSIGTVETLLSLSEENCKNSNQLAVCITPLQPYQGQNPCLERNLLSSSSDSLLIDKSSKHCTNSESQNLVTNDYLGYQKSNRAMPIPFVQNAVHDSQCSKIGATSTPKSKFNWDGFKKLFNNRKGSNSKLLKNTQVRIIPGKLVNSFGQNGVTTSVLNENKRPSTLPLLSVKNEDVAKCNFSGVTQLLTRRDSLNRQRSLEQFTEIFSSTTDLTRLKDPSLRIKTPGDVPPSVRRTRGKAAKDSARFSLYDDRIMSQWGSAPDLEPTVVPPRPPQLNDLQDRDSISSF